MEPVIVDKDVYRKMKADMRQDIRKGICNKSDAIYILSISEKAFYDELNSPNTEIVRSKKQGKFILSSVLREFERIHGVPYKDAII